VTHAELVARAVRWLRGTHRCPVVFGELATYDTGEVPDAIGWRRGWQSILVECKTSRSDFRREKDKIRERRGRGGVGRERWYLTPPGLVLAGLLDAAFERRCAS